MAILPNGLNLSQAFVGNSEIQSAWLGNTKIWEKSGGRLPAGYTELSYIESTGTQYIDTGVSPATRLKCEYNGNLTTISASGHHRMVGFFNRYNGGDGLTCGWANEYGYGYFRYANPDSSYYSWLNSNNIADTNIHTFTVDFLDYQYCIDNSVYQINNYYRNFDNNNLLLFAIWSEEQPTQEYEVQFTAYFKLRYAKFWDVNRNLIRNFVPCTNPQNEVGMYDLVSQSFFGNAGTGSFIAGDPIRTYLYNAGDECTALTGGWISNNNSVGTGTVTKYSNYASVYAEGISNANANVCMVTNNAIDVTSYSSLRIAKSVTGWDNDKNNVEILLASTKPSRGGYDVTLVVGKAYSQDISMVVDISSITGSYYVIIRSWSGYTSPVYPITTDVSQIWLE